VSVLDEYPDDLVEVADRDESADAAGSLPAAGKCASSTGGPTRLKSHFASAAKSMNAPPVQLQKATLPAGGDLGPRDRARG